MKSQDSTTPPVDSIFRSNPFFVMVSICVLLMTTRAVGNPLQISAVPQVYCPGTPLAIWVYSDCVTYAGALEAFVNGSPVTLVQQGNQSWLGYHYPQDTGMLELKAHDSCEWATNSIFYGESGPRPGTWTCLADGSNTNYFYTNHVICIGTGIPTPSPSGTSFSPGKKVRTLTWDCQNPTTETNGVPYSAGPVYFVPAIPSTFTNAGTFSFSVKVDGTNSTGLCSSVITKTLGTVTVNVGSGLITINAVGRTGAAWLPDWASQLAELAGSPFSFSAPGGISTTTYHLIEMFCCGDGTTGKLDYDKRTVLQDPAASFGVSANLNALSGFSGVIATIVDFVQDLPSSASVVSAINSWGSAAAGFSATGAANYREFDFSDQCQGCTGNPRIMLGTSSASVQGTATVGSDLLDVHIAVGGYVNSERRGWISYYGPNVNNIPWNVQKHLTYHIYWSYNVGSRTDSGDFLPAGETYTPNTLSPVSVCLGPNFPGP